MRVRHLNCGTMPVPGDSLVCHVLLLETDNGLVLVDSGYGLADCASPARRLGPLRHVIRPVLDPEETAARQIENLGYSTDDVRHIVVTHFDLDHVGGIADFPGATVHATATEVTAAQRPRTTLEHGRYRRRQWAHGPTLVTHEPVGESWRGFAAAQELTAIAPGVVLISLPGHTRGHAAIAVDAGNRWVLHCGDAFHHRGAIEDETSTPWTMRVTETALAMDRKQLRRNQERIAELRRRAEPDLVIVNAHDRTLFDRAVASA